MKKQNWHTMSIKDKVDIIKKAAKESNEAQANISAKATNMSNQKQPQRLIRRDKCTCHPIHNRDGSWTTSTTLCEIHNPTISRPKPSHAIHRQHIGKLPIKQSPFVCPKHHRILIGKKICVDCFPRQYRIEINKSFEKECPNCKSKLCGCEADEQGVVHFTCAHTLCNLSEKENGWELEEELAGILGHNHWRVCDCDLGKVGLHHCPVDVFYPKLKKLLSKALSQSHTQYVKKIVNILMVEKEAIKFLRSKKKKVPSIEDTLDEVLSLLGTKLKGEKV